MIWIVIGKMFINESFTKNMAVINGKTVQIYAWIDISAEIYCIKKINPLRDASFGADCLTSFKILEIITIGLKNGFW